MSNNSSVNFNINLLVTKTPLTHANTGIFTKQPFAIDKNNSLNNLKHKDGSM